LVEFVDPASFLVFLPCLELKESNLSGIMMYVWVLLQLNKMNERLSSFCTVSDAPSLHFVL
jgi:hypothetical protein